MDKLPIEFYLENAIITAKRLLGKILVAHRENSVMTARIVETEAYMGTEDKAAHSYNNRQTQRTKTMYREGGLAYVYLIYGIYNCLNVVCNQKGIPQAVLIRALEPLSGIPLMENNRFGNSLRPKNKYNLTNGPGKLCKALNITREDNGKSFLSDELYFCEDSEFLLQDQDVVTTTRIGIDYAEEAKDFLYRFYIKQNPYVSKKITENHHGIFI